MKRSSRFPVALLVAACAFSSCKLDLPKEEQTSFETLTIEKQDIVIPVKFSAKLKGHSDVTISPQVSGQLLRIAVSEGQQVRQGTVLFQIDSRNAQLDLEAAQANLFAAQAQENSAKMEYESNRNLFDKNIVSRHMLENSENSYKQAQAAVKQAEAALSRAKVNLGFCTITSPVAGVIGEIPVFAGDQVSPGTRLTMVSGNSVMHAIFSLPEAELEAAYANGFKGKLDDALKLFPDVTFVMKNGTEYPHKGRIVSVTGVVNAATGTIQCKAAFPNPDGILYSGIQGSIVFPADEKGVILIPQNALVRLQDKSLVYKVQPDSTAAAVVVTTQSSGSGQDIIVRTGLQEGDVIVTEGANNVQEGQRVLF
ncbi:MAG: efflux RND transporter periplasmic adaptor subunit [Bacteroidales bacterium]|nr:efflux RND transporter periplasmic adaptor subunit [Bacteroidales bacterium]